MPAEATDLHLIPLIRLAFAIDRVQRGNLGRACYSQVNPSISFHCKGDFPVCHRAGPIHHILHTNPPATVFSHWTFTPP